MKKNKYNYWIRTTLGLEQIVLDEISEKIKIDDYLIKQRNLFILTSEQIKEKEFFKNIRTADDVYKFIGIYEGVDKTKPSIGGFIKYVRSNVLPIILNYKDSIFFRSTVSFVGERNFNRFFVEDEIKKIIEETTRLKVLSSENADKRETGELRLRCHIENNEVYVGIAITDTPLHRRSWRVENYDAQLLPTIAAAIVRLVVNIKGQKIIDPFCGSGTIIIESAIVNKNMQNIGFDLNAEILNIARKRASLAEVDVAFYEKDAFNNETDYSNSIILSNPPWGEKHEINNNQDFINNLKKLILKSNGAVMIITDEIFKKLTETGLSLEKITETRVRGKSAIIVRFIKK